MKEFETIIRDLAKTLGEVDELHANYHKGDVREVALLKTYGLINEALDYFGKAYGQEFVSNVIDEFDVILG